MDVSGDPRTTWRPLVAPALVAVVIIVSLGNAREALAQVPGADVGVDALGDAAVGDAPAQASQLAEQVAVASQAAAAEAAVLQAQPVNVSPPSTPATVEQSNDAAAEADATNANAVMQELGQAQAAAAGGGAGGTPVQGQAAGQGAQPSQAAAAQAGAAQTQPINIAIPVVVNSPNSHPVVTQTNSTVAAAGAANTSSIVQGASQTQLGAANAGGAAAGPGATPPAPGAEASGSLGDPLAQNVQDGPAGQAGTVSIWVWNWTWNWTVPEVSVPAIALPGVKAPSVAAIAPSKNWPPGLDAVSILDELAAVVDEVAAAAEEVAPVAGEVTATLDAAIVPAAPELAGPDPAGAQDADGRRDVPEREPTAPSVAGWTSTGGEIDPPLVSPLSSNLVQSPASERKRRERSTERADRPLAPPLPRHSAPAGAGGLGISPAGLVLGALLLLALQLASVAFALGRRFDLASAAWRRQAYLSPLERPG